MEEPPERFWRDSIALIAHQLSELCAYVGSINAMLARTDNPDVAAEARDMNKGLTELHTSIARLADAFPPPPENGGRRRRV